jgi:hypothetical protein
VSVDWLTALTPIYASGAGLRSMASFSVNIPGLNITVTFTPRMFANAINTSTRTTIQQAMRRTSPRTFAVLLRAAWKLHINHLDLLSAWRPMLGSRLHKMGDALDVVYFDDNAEHIHEDITNKHKLPHHQTPDNHPFPTDAGGKKLSALYDELNKDSESMHGAIYTPWINWVLPHDTHMHITVKDE